MQMLGDALPYIVGAACALGVAVSAWSVRDTRRKYGARA